MYEALKRLRRRVYWSFVSLLVAGINRFPHRLRLDIQAATQIIKSMDYEEHEIRLNIDSRIENDIRLHSCKKEPETIDWIQSSFRPGDVFYDVGANVGAYSLVASKFLKGDIKVYAIEPSFVTFPQLCKNIITNVCQDSIIPLQMALSDTTGIDDFNYNNLIPGGAIHALGEPIDYKGDIFQPVVRQPLCAYRIDDLIKYLHIPVPNHIKIDVDGIEFNILQGAESTLGNPQLRSLLVELEQEDECLDKIVDFLASTGFHVHSRHKYVYGGESDPFSNVYNYVFQR